MLPFLLGHATHPDWRMALALSAAQIDAGLAAQRDEAPDEPAAAHLPTLGLVYFTDHYADAAEALLAELQQRWPSASWVGSVGVGIAANGVEYFDQPALALLLGKLPREQFRLFSGEQALPKPGGLPGQVPPAGSGVWAALVHADGHATDLPELLTELAERTDSGYLFGGLASSRGRTVTLADAVYQGGVSGVAFTHEVGLVSRVSQGCAPVGPTRRITRSERNLVLELDGRPALDCLVEDLALDLGQPRQAMSRLRTTLAGLADAGHDMLARRGQFGTDTRVRHLLGLDPTRRGVAIAELVEPGQQLAFCQRDTDAARRDLMRICSEIREELSPAEEDAGTLLNLAGAGLPDWSTAWRGLGGARVVAPDTSASTAGTSGAPPAAAPGETASADTPAGAGKQAAAPVHARATLPDARVQAPHRPEDQVAAAIYISCAGRGGPHFGAPSAELKIVQHALGDVPLIGFFAGGEIARHHLYGYTGVLTVLRTSPPDGDTRRAH